MTQTISEMLLVVCMLIAVAAIIVCSTSCEDHRSKARIECYVATKDKEFCK